MINIEASSFWKDFLLELIPALSKNVTTPLDTDRFKRPNAIISFLKKTIFSRLFFHGYNLVPKLENLNKKEIEKIAEAFARLANDASRNLLIKLLVYRILGSDHVSLPLNNKIYWNEKNNILKYLEPTARIIIYHGQASPVQKMFQIFDRFGFHFFISNSILGKRHKIPRVITNRLVNVIRRNLCLYNLSKKGLPIRLYALPGNISNTFVLNQYQYSNLNSFKIKKGDYIIDAGACWGDTSLYFACKTGKDGNVFAFEFIPRNIEVFKKNMELNPNLSSTIHLIKKPLWRATKTKVYYLDKGPGSKIDFKMIKNYTGACETVTIDDFINENKIDRIDLIKMDIEGAELDALMGAQDTIRKYKPKLAISIYHTISQYYEIQDFIYSLNLNYIFFIDHFTTHLEETVLFALPT